MSAADATGSPTRATALLLLVAAFALAALLRSIGFERVFLPDGQVVFANSDAFYHMRRTLYTMLQYPEWLRFDACINHPDGAAVPHPPGYDFAVATLARIAGGSLRTLETLAAWLPVVLGALGVFPVYALGRMLEGRGVGIGAAIFYALLPVAVNYSRVGNADHHAAAGLLGALLLSTYVWLLGSETSRILAGFTALLFTRLAMLLVWHGSLLYLGVGELALLLVAAGQGRRDLLRGQALSCLGVAILLLPVVATSVVPRDGAYAATELSRLHVLLFAAASVTAGLVFRLTKDGSLASPRSRLLAAAGVGAAVGGSLLLIPGVGEALVAAFDFLSKSDRWGASVLEQLPLFYARGELAFAAGEKWLGYLAYLLPVVPLAFVPLLESSEQRGRAVLMIVWSLVFGALAFSQVRYANDYAAAGCVGAALLIAQLSRWVSRRAGEAARVPTALLAGLLLLAPLWPRYYAILLPPTLEHLSGRGSARDPALLSLEGTQLRFAQRVRSATPASPGCGPEPGEPAYGILAHPAIGHVLHYVARRATPADPFGPYIGQQNFDELQRALHSDSEREVIAVAERLRTPYLLTADDASPWSASVMQRLHRDHGSASESAEHLARFRLLEEGPVGGVALAAAFGPEQRDALPYKLFEIVAGAVLEVPAPAGTIVHAVVSVRAPAGGRFFYRAQGHADPDGFARLRVPYASEGSGSAALGDEYRVVTSERRWQISVPEEAVLEGRTLRLGADPS